MKPAVTRLRYVSARKPSDLELFLSRLGFRVQIYGGPTWDGKRWWVWFVPPDDIAVDVKSTEL